VVGNSSQRVSTDVKARNYLLQNSQLARYIRACRGCSLRRTCTAPVPGIGPHLAPIVIVGRNPGAEEDAKGEPFVGRSGRGPLAELLTALGVKREQVGIINTLSCFTPDNRSPEAHELAACRDNREAQLKFFTAKRLVITLGREARNWLLPQDAMRPMADSETEPLHTDSYWLWPLRHPSFFLRNAAAYASFKLEKLPEIRTFASGFLAGGN